MPRVSRRKVVRFLGVFPAGSPLVPKSAVSVSPNGRLDGLTIRVNTLICSVCVTIWSGREKLGRISQLLQHEINDCVHCVEN